MENILTKALDEALTERYAQELGLMPETGYGFSDVFKSDMKRLIRKTDRPVTAFTPYIAAAACGFIAIGAALLIPLSGNGSINTSGSDTDTGTPDIVSETSETTVTEETPAQITRLPEMSVTDESTRTAPTVSADTYDTTVTADTTTLETTASSVTVTTAPTQTVSQTDTVSESTVTASVSSSLSETTVSTANAETVSEVHDDETVADYEPAPLPPNEVGQAESFGGMLSQSFEGISAEEMYADGFAYLKDERREKEFYRTLYDGECVFIQDFIHSLSDSETAEKQERSEDEPYVRIFIQNAAPKEKNTRLFNNSDWLFYPSLYRADNGDDFDDTEFTDDVIPLTEDEAGGMTLMMDINLYKDGYFDISRLRYKGEDMDVPYGFTADADSVTALFDALDKTYLPKNAQTLSDIVSAMDINTENIAVTAEIHGVYDTRISGAPVSAEEVLGILERYSGAALDECKPGSFYTGVKFSVDIKSSGASLTLFLDGFGSGFISDDRRAYSFDVSENEIKDAAFEAAIENDLNMPYYETAEDFLRGKSFTRIERISSLGGGITEVTDKEELEKMFDLLYDEIRNAQYLPAYEHLGVEHRIKLWIAVPNFSFGNIQLWSDDTLDINDNLFRLSEGAVQRLCDAFLSNGKTTKYLYEDDGGEPVDNDTDGDAPPDI